MGVITARLPGVILLMLTLGGCVTTMEGGNSSANPEKALDAHVQLGLNYLSVRDRDQARFHLTKALELDKRSAPANDGMAMLYQVEGENELAEKYFKRALRYDRNFSRAHNNYGIFLYQHERYEEAYKQFEIASEDTEYNARPTALANLGRVALQLGYDEKAEAAFRHALNLDPRQTGAMAELAELAFKREDYAEAKQLIDRYGRVSQQSAQTLWLGIRLERIFGNRDQEMSYALQLKNLHPYSSEYLEYKQSLGDESL